MTSKLNEDVVQGWRDGIPLKRGGLQKMLLTLFFLLDMSGYITGQVLNVDGGMLT
jgi:3-oxoacyl-[acyl-carrier protein] reductase